MSKILYEKVVNAKLAQIILEEDNITVSIIYDSVCLYSNILDINLVLTDFSYDSFLDLFIEYHTSKAKTEAELDFVCKDLEGF